MENAITQKKTQKVGLNLESRDKKNYRKNRRFNQWTEEAMQNALREYQATTDTSAKKLRTVGRAWGIPKSTLQRRLAGKVSGHAHESGRKPVLSQEAENELADVIRMLALRGFPLGALEVRQLAAQYSSVNNLGIFKKKVAGYYWFRGFMSRHSDLRIKKPEALSAQRAMGTNKVVVGKWFEDYEALLQKLGIKDLP